MHSNFSRPSGSWLRRTDQNMQNFDYSNVLLLFPSALASSDIISDEVVEENPQSQPSSSSERKKKFRFNARQDIMLLREVLQINPYSGGKWVDVSSNLDLNIDARRCKERTQLLKDYIKKEDRERIGAYQNFPFWIIQDYIFIRWEDG